MHRMQLCIIIEEKSHAIKLKKRSSEMKGKNAQRIAITLFRRADTADNSMHFISMRCSLSLHLSLRLFQPLPLLNCIHFVNVAEVIIYINVRWLAVPLFLSIPPAPAPAFNLSIRRLCDAVRSDLAVSYYISSGFALQLRPFYHFNFYFISFFFILFYFLVFFLSNK